jgi:hypothetical protein
LGDSFSEFTEYGYLKQSIVYYLKYHESVALQEIFNRSDSEINLPYYISPCDLPYSRKKFISQKSDSMLGISAFYGSVLCFKFLFLNGGKIDESVCSHSVQGGNLEILKICEKNIPSFTMCLSVAIEYHNNEIADWLLSNFSMVLYSFHSAIRSYNINGIFFLLFSNPKINDFSECGSSPLSIAAKLIHIDIYAKCFSNMVQIQIYKIR